MGVRVDYSPNYTSVETTSANYTGKCAEGHALEYDYDIVLHTDTLSSEEGTVNFTYIADHYTQQTLDKARRDHWLRFVGRVY